MHAPKRLLLAVLTATLLPLSAAMAQDDSASSSGNVAAGGQPVRVITLPPPQTKLEKMAAEKGVVITKTYADVSTITGEDGGDIRIVALEYKSGDRKEYGIAVCVHRQGRYERVATSFVDESDINELATTLDSLGKMQGSSTSGTNFESTYQTKGDLTIANVSTNGTRMLQIRSTQVLAPSGELLWSSAHFRLARIQEIQQQLAAAKAMIARFKAPPAETPAAENK